MSFFAIYLKRIRDEIRKGGSVDGLKGHLQSVLLKQGS